MRVQRVFLCFAAAVAVGILGCDEVSFPTTAPDEEFQAALSGANEVPTVATTATGAMTFAVVLDTFLTFRLNVVGIDSTRAARVYVAAAGVTGGDTVATLFTGPTTCTSSTQTSPSCRVGFSGELAQGQLRPSQLTKLPVGYGATDRAKFDSLLVLMRNGSVYVNVHTKKNPGGEVRGQVAPE